VRDEDFAQLGISDLRRLQRGTAVGARGAAEQQSARAAKDSDLEDALLVGITPFQAGHGGSMADCILVKLVEIEASLSRLQKVLPHPPQSAHGHAACQDDVTTAEHGYAMDACGEDSEDKPSSGCTLAATMQRIGGDEDGLGCMIGAGSTAQYGGSFLTKRDWDAVAACASGMDAPVSHCGSSGKAAFRPEDAASAGGREVHNKEPAAVPRGFRLVPVRGGRRRRAGKLAYRCRPEYVVKDEQDEQQRAGVPVAAAAFAAGAPAFCLLPPAATSGAAGICGAAGASRLAGEGRDGAQDAFEAKVFMQLRKIQDPEARRVKIGCLTELLRGKLGEGGHEYIIALLKKLDVEFEDGG
jgi:hypothetical protein